MPRRLVYDWFHWLDNTLFGDYDVRGDEIRGGDGNDKLFGLGGDDLLSGGNDNDFLSGDAGNDIVRGGAGSDTMFMDRGDNSFEGGSGTDTLDFRAVLVIQGGITGGGTYQFQESAVGFSIDLESGVTRASTLGSDAFTDLYGTNTFSSIELYSLTNRNDILRGDDGADVIQTRGGNDLIEGRGGADTINGGAGSDTASYESSPLSVDVDLSRGLGVQIGGDAAGDVLQSVENLIGSAFNDLLSGNGSDNRIDGGGGADELTGGGGRDVLRGGAGRDAFIFERTSDSTGNFNQRDIVEDFVRNLDTLSGRRILGDTIDLHAIDADQRSGRIGNQDFDFVGDDPFTGVGQVRAIQAQDAEGRNFTLVEAETNGDGVADFALTVFTTNDTLLDASNFIF